jgi:hypothetical protein
MNFTTEEITLCKEIAKYYRKPIKKGDYIAREVGELQIPYIEYVDIVNRDGDSLVVNAIENKIYRIYSHSEGFVINGDYQVEHELIPIFTWQDARGWLKEKGFYGSLNDLGKFKVYLAYKNFLDEEGAERMKQIRIMNQGNTDTEAVLKVILEILKEEKCNEKLATF